MGNPQIAISTCHDAHFRGRKPRLSYDKNHFLCKRGPAPPHNIPLDIPEKDENLELPGNSRPDKEEMQRREEAQQAVWELSSCCQEGKIYWMPPC